MVVRPRPGVFRMLVTMRGSIVPRILPQMLYAAGLGALVASGHAIWPATLPAYSFAPFAVFGISLSIFLGFRNNAAYDRWWEARREWGTLVAEVRSLARATATFIAPDAPERRRLLHLAVVFAHSLRGSLRDEDVTADTQPWRDPCDAIVYSRYRVPAASVLRTMGEDLYRMRVRDVLDLTGARVLDERLAAFASVQASCERISNTPLPFAYALLVHRTAYVYCFLLPFAIVSTVGWCTPLFTAIVAYTFFGLDALSEELEEPFGHADNDLALNALCRTIEIEVAEATGKTPPQALRAEEFVLT
ncbi:bestrophin family protein [Halofilum ochraceum]|uniref:bestrophin family protein n=1 Tax=Halofilum ochraceum TaxID=1611323 RepID=UPI0008D9B984|nr:bestrophin family ion channel [Halofilum ochraceum]